MVKQHNLLAFWLIPLVMLSILLAGCGANASITVTQNGLTATVTSQASTTSGGSISIGSSSGGSSSSGGGSTTHPPTTTPTNTPTASPAYGVDTCINGYVWRDAFTNDNVCVTSATRDQTAYDNNQAASRVVH